VNDRCSRCFHFSVALAANMNSYKCETCGDNFGSYNPNPRFCSRECKAGAQRATVDPTHLRALYENGMSQTEVALELGVTQKLVHSAMKRLGIPARVAAKRNQSGEANHMWKGEDASYKAFHNRLTAAKGQPQRCEECGTDDSSKQYDWANLTGNYADMSDYRRMCRSCHWRYDERHKNFKGAVGGRSALKGGANA
jgi:hypothetical protein